MKKEITHRINKLLNLSQEELIETGKNAIFTILNALKKWLVNETDFEKKAIIFLLKALGTFIFADGQLQDEEYEFFLQIMNSNEGDISQSTLEKMLKKSGKNYLGDVVMLNELIDNLANHDDEEISIIKKALCSLGIIFCSLDGHVTKDEADLIEYYLND
jgi:hypothetical protein